jgi:hypothetical protein
LLQPRLDRWIREPGIDLAIEALDDVVSKSVALTAAEAATNNTV